MPVSAEWVAVFTCLGLIIGGVLKGLHGRWFVNGRNGMGQEIALLRQSVESLQRATDEGFSNLGSRLYSFEARHRQDISKIHERIEGLDAKFVTKDAWQAAREK